MGKDEQQTQVPTDICRTAIRIPRGHVAYLNWLATQERTNRDAIIAQIIEQHREKLSNQGMAPPGL